MGGSLPLKPSPDGNKRNLIVVDDLLNCDFLDRQSPSVTLPKQFGYDRQLLDQNTLLSRLEDNRLTLLQVFIRGNPFRGSAGLTAIAQNFSENLLQSGLVQGVIIYGSPYLLDWFLPKFPSSIPWVFTYGQMAQSQAIATKTLFGISEISQETKDALGTHPTFYKSCLNYAIVTTIYWNLCSRSLSEQRTTHFNRQFCDIFTRNFHLQKIISLIFLYS